MAIEEIFDTVMSINGVMYKMYIVKIDGNYKIIGCQNIIANQHNYNSEIVNIKK